ncbi:hypothetical protein LCGC14_0877970 [marine sediment metagenome]|uniref:Uncharacterized protein n=1 Tax=marine sediment metagenome TaxID=412755 RepID=A0A0F9P2R1_9ZZZZ
MARSPTYNRYMAAFDPTKRRADQAQDFYLEGATNFDPTASVERYGQAAYRGFERNLGRKMETLRGSAVGAGRLDTGFQTEDEDRVVTDLGERYHDSLARQSLGATALEQRNLEGVGAYGAGQQNSYLDLISGQLDRETAEKNAKKKLIGDVLGSLFGAGGRIAGGLG